MSLFSMLFWSTSQKLSFQRLPYTFVERLIHLAPFDDLHNLGEACPDVKKRFNPRLPDLHNQVKITDSPDVCRSALKMVFWLRILHFFTCLRPFYDGLLYPIWRSALSVDEVIDRKRLIYVTDTVILHCESIENYEKVIPFIVGPYRRLIINGNITYQQVQRLVTCASNVKQVLINARIHFEPGEHSNFVDLVMQFCRGPLYRFSYDPKCNTKRLYLYLKEAYRDNKVCAVFGYEERERVDVQYPLSTKRFALMVALMFHLYFWMMFCFNGTLPIIMAFLFMIIYCFVFYYLLGETVSKQH